MALVIEDGTGVAGANVWEAVATSAAWLDERGLTQFGLLTTEAQEATAITAVQLFSVLVEPKIDGERLEEDQGLPFPRKNFTDGEGHQPTDIPYYVPIACRYFMHDAATGKTLFPGDDTAGILSDRVGPVTVAYQWGSSRGAETRHYWAWHYLSKAFDPNRRR